MENVVQKISVDLIDDPVIAMRSDIDESYIDELGRSIKENGLINPITVKKVGERFEVVAGHQRLLASRRVGVVLIDTIVRDLTSEQSLIITAHENMVRQDVNPVDEAVFLGRLFSEKELSVEQIATMLRRSTEWVEQRLGMLTYPESVLIHIANKAIPLGAADALMKIPDEATRINFIEIAAKDGITVERARAWLSMYSVGQIGASTTGEELAALAAPEEHNEAMISCAKCSGAGKIRDMITVWIHKDCPSGSVSE